jgi:transposase
LLDWSQWGTSVEVILGKERRQWSTEEKRALVAETFAEGATVNAVARRHRVNPSMLFVWRKQYREELAAVAGPAAPEDSDPHGLNPEHSFVPVAIAPPAPCARPAGSSRSNPMIELRFGHGASMRIVGAVDPVLAVAVMKAMQRR